jgi:hypothetical protein
MNSDGPHAYHRSLWSRLSRLTGSASCEPRPEEAVVNAGKRSNIAGHHYE